MTVDHGQWWPMVVYDCDDGVYRFFLVNKCVC